MTAWPYRFAVLSVDALFVDASYQRPLTTFAKRIRDQFDPALLGTLIVSARAEDRFAVVDGQTRAEAVRQLAATGDAPGVVPCLVYDGLSRADEANLFARLQKERRGIASYHRFRAALVAGDEEAIDIQRIAKAAGYEVGPAAKTQISAVAGLEKVYRRSPQMLERVLGTFRRAWRDQHMPNGELLRGLGYFFDHTKTVDDVVLAQRLGEVTPANLARRASALREGMGHGGGSDKYMAGAIAGIYRSGALRRAA